MYLSLNLFEDFQIHKLKATLQPEVQQSRNWKIIFSLKGMLIRLKAWLEAIEKLSATHTFRTVGSALKGSLAPYAISVKLAEPWRPRSTGQDLKEPWRIRQKRMLSLPHETNLRENDIYFLYPCHKVNKSDLHKFKNR